MFRTVSIHTHMNRYLSIIKQRLIVLWNRRAGLISYKTLHHYPNIKVHEANMGPTWVMSAPDGPHVVPINLAIRVLLIKLLHASTAITIYNKLHQLQESAIVRHYKFRENVLFYNIEIFHPWSSTCFMRTPYAAITRLRHINQGSPVTRWDRGMSSTI